MSALSTFIFNHDIKSFASQSAVAKNNLDRNNFGTDSYYKVTIKSRDSEHLEQLSSLNTQQTLMVEPAANSTQKERDTLAQNITDLIMSQAALSNEGVDVVFYKPDLKEGYFTSVKAAGSSLVKTSHPEAQKAVMAGWATNMVNSAHQFESKLKAATQRKYA
jgi:hypothetical protein